MGSENEERRDRESTGSPRGLSSPRGATRPDPLDVDPYPDSYLDRLPPDEDPVGAHIPDSFLYEPSHDLGLWRDIFERDVRFRFSSHRGLVGRGIVWLKQLFGRFVRAPLSDHLQRDRIFNIVIIRHLEKQLDELRKDILPIQDRFSALRDHALPDLINRSDCLYGMLDRRIDEMEAEIQRTLAEVKHHAATVPVVRTVGAGVTDAAPVARSPEPSAIDDSTYYAFESLHRGAEAEIRERQSIYVDIFAGRKRVVDLGCGRGEMLDLLAAAEIDSYGVDVNSSMVVNCRKRGHEVIQGTAQGHLVEVEDESLGGVFSAQTFEHWERDDIVEAVKLIYRKLEDGAPFVMETQNPVSVMVGASSFWRDLTHVRPIHPDAFEFLVKATGFRAVEVRPLSPYPESDLLPRVRVPEDQADGQRQVAEDVNRTIDAIDKLLHGHRDYAVVAYK